MGHVQVGAVAGRQLADADQQLDAALAGDLADLAVVLGGVRAQLTHVPEHRDPAAGHLPRGEVVEGSPH